MAGTTVDDGGAVVEAFARTLAPLGIGIGARELQPFRGANKVEVLRHFLRQQLGDRSEAELAAASARFSAEVGRAYADGALAEIAGAGDIFDGLRANGVLVALNSGFPRVIVDLVVKRLGWAGLVDATISGDDVVAGRPAPDLIRAAMAHTGTKDAGRVVAVGDTRLDLQAGTRAGCGAVVGVLSGAGTRDELSREPHTHLCTTIAEVPAITQ
jgi:phosphonatase-like hydrolase